MKVYELLETLLNVDENMETNIDSIENNGKSLNMSVQKKTRRKRATKSESLDRLRKRIDNGDFSFNFKDMSYIFEICVHDIRKTPYSSNIPRDTVQIKKVFPNITTFTDKHYNIVRKYIEIFDSCIATPNYKNPTWGGLVYAMPKVKRALEEEKRTNIRQGNIEVVKEVF